MITLDRHEGKAPKDILVYIAGPFFNKPQVAATEFLEKELQERGFRIYSPRLHSGSGSFTPEDRTNPEKWQEVFNSNVSAISACDIMVAMMEYPLPNNIQLGLCKEDRSTQGDPWVLETELNLPDNGTVWEMGAAYDLVPVIGYYVNGAPSKLNLMLGKCCNAVFGTQADLIHAFKVDDEGLWDCDLSLAIDMAKVGMI